LNRAYNIKINIFEYNFNTEIHGILNFTLTQLHARTFFTIYIYI